MADVILTSHQGIPDGLLFKYKDMGDGTHALQIYIGAAQASLIVYNEDYNGTGWDYHRNNTNLIVLPSAAYANSNRSDPLTNYNALGAYLLWDITTVPNPIGGNSVQLFVDILEPDGTYTAIYQTAALTTVGLRKYLLYPGATDTGGQLTAVCQLPLPRSWSVRITHTAADDFVYAVSAYYVGA